MTKQKYIDAEKLKAEIDSLKDHIRNMEEWQSLCKILSFIDSLQQEQPEVDLEKVIDGLTAGWREGEEYGELQNINTHQCVALEEVKDVMCCMFELGLKAGKEEAK